ncbi:hypothetical protein G7L40_20395 [Paenibacillus polymyxa]|uniref:Uncharacterized protein n=1 Tax=Paenibacillus polymyxa TaxID=1406 RepID=A0A378XZ61_PAEPO|nr:hypothetical protein [Paenibacillus polymyxa]MBE7896150.1 hypothetical protein [Paenibacillus polymyxa]MBG9765906.1 hypothetical protein [Paenibacillus polymyxa]QPK54829.1 hypothetical protein G7035_20440 [Paenibacillus polymyxa]QPK59920.1 hypothetical protein G7L40_20395 [Paenibacillus polymyxa]UOD84490.1 hypothetical protein CUU60_04455 [Paenibacillus polymyxa ATCC 842]
MKIVCIDNFDRESVSDKLVCENVSEHYGNAIVDFLNEKFSGDYSSDFYKLTDDKYELYKWEP